MLPFSWYNGSAKWYKMKKVQVRAFGRVPEGDKYKNGTSHDEKMRVTPLGITLENVGFMRVLTSQNTSPAVP